MASPRPNNEKATPRQNTDLKALEELTTKQKMLDDGPG